MQNLRRMNSSAILQLNIQHSTFNFFIMIKKLFTLFICMFSFAMTFTSCSDEAFDVDSVNKQTIFVFFPWTGGTSNPGLYDDLEHNLDSISEGIIAKKGLNDSRVLVFFSEKYNQSTLYDLQYDAKNKKVNRVPIKKYEGNSYCSAEGFADLLNDVKQNAEALNYALIIGAHGCGWTYAEDWSNYPYKARPSFGSSSPKSNSFSGINFGSDSDEPHTRFFGSVDLKDNAIDVATLAEGIRESGLKMQYILFDACYMGNVETAYELKDVTNFFIASSSEIMQYGLPYKLLWNYLNSPTPSYSSIVSTSINFYKTTKDPYLNIAAIDCRELDGLANIMKEINSKYTLSESIDPESIQHLDGFSPNLFYDMEAYVDSLYPSGYLLDQFKNQLNLTVKAAGHTDYAFSALYYKKTYIEIKNYCGLSISDPSQNNVAIKGREKTGWWKATH